MAPAAELGFATIDLDREGRQGLAEAVYAPGKRPWEIRVIVATLLDRSAAPVLVTRVEPDVASELADLGGRYDRAARLLSWRPTATGRHRVAVVTAGTADGPVAAEAAAVACTLGLAVTEFRDVGVAGVQRLLDRVDEIGQADVVIVVAGMEGALASVLGGLVGTPVIAVPTSTGYGAALDGLTALLAMLSSCAAGVCVVNIDSGFGAAMAAYRLVFAMRRFAVDGPAVDRHAQ